MKIRPTENRKLTNSAGRLLVLIAWIVAMPYNQGNAQGRTHYEMKKGDARGAMRAGDCLWLHQQVLQECRSLSSCSSAPEFSMSTQRGLLEFGMQKSSEFKFYTICEQVCSLKSTPSFQAFRKSFCDIAKFGAPQNY